MRKLQCGCVKQINTGMNFSLVSVNVSNLTHSVAEVP